MPENAEGDQTAFQSSWPDLLGRFWWLGLIVVLVMVVVLVDTAVSGSYDSLTMLLGLFLGATSGWMLVSRAGHYVPAWGFWALVGVSGVAWIVSVIVGAFVLYPGWIFGLLFSLPMMLALSLIASAVLLHDLSTARE